MSNITSLIQTLENGTRDYINASSSRPYVEDDHGYLTKIDMVSSKFIRLHKQNLIIIDKNSTYSQSSIAIVFSNNAYYIVLNNNSIVIVDSNNLTVLNTMNLSDIHRSRDIIVLNNGRILFVNSIYDNYIVFFNQSDSSPLNYIFAYRYKTNYSGPHELQI